MISGSRRSPSRSNVPNGGCRNRFTAALVAASEKGLTVSDNVEAFSELGFAPHVVGAIEKRDLSTTVMGQEISLPVIISPTGVQAVDPDGEVAVARAAAARGTAMGLSSFASKPIEEVVAANGKLFFQVYWLGGRDAIAERVERARQAGAVGLIATTDWTFSHGRDWGSPKIPEQMNLRTILRLSPEAITRPGWLWKYGKTLRPPDLRVPNQARRGEAGPPFFAAYGEWMGTPPPTWDDIAWLRELWGGPFMLKGVMRVDDAKRAVDAGVSAISVSNHGGNNLDGTPAAIRALPAVVDAVGNQIEVLLDGGIRRGSDVVKALAFGARAVMIGRAYLWGLAAAGQAGVENVLDILRGGIDSSADGARAGFGARPQSGRHRDTAGLCSSARSDRCRRAGAPTRRAGNLAAAACETSEYPDTHVADVAPVTGFNERSEGKSFSGAPTIDARQVNSAYHRRVVVHAELGGSTSSQLRALSSAGLVIPIGSTEQHGPHLPLDTDTRIATAVAREVTARLTGAEGPTVPGCTGCWHRPSPTATAASTRASRERSPSAPRR